MTASLFTSCADGLKGKDGNNNVLSMIKTVKSSDWSGDGYQLKAVIKIPELTNDVISNGIVQVYNNPEEMKSHWQALPYTQVGDNGLMLRFSFEEGELTIFIESDKDELNGVNGSYDYKIVIIGSAESSEN